MSQNAKICWDGKLSNYKLYLKLGWIQWNFYDW
jgi:hypothetical protein